MLHHVTNDYSRTIKIIEEKVEKKINKMLKKREEFSALVHQQKQISLQDKECNADMILDTKTLKNSFTLMEQYNVKIRTLD